MADLCFKNIQKIYDNGVQAVFDFNLDVKDKEFIVLVGPSGCGKSTTLRMLAGLEEISEGEISIDGKIINNVAPKDRDIAMVFQNYALYPHMNVYNNMAFALKLRKIPFKVLDDNGNEIVVVDEEKVKKLQEEKEILMNPDIVYAPGYVKEKVDSRIIEIDNLIKEEKEHPSKIKTVLRHYTKQEIDEKITEVSNILGLNPYLKRKPAALSGGQRQRVALGRAIVRNPKVFLMDEPLSNLDAKLRVQMRSEITKIHKRVNATTIYVTHDQTEAMTMASRIVIMKDGYIQQIGTPKDVYNNPTNMFVAGFIGSPAMNFLKGKFNGNQFITDDSLVTINLSKEQCESLANYENRAVILGIRPEDIYLEDDPSKENPSNKIKIKCDISELLGHELIVYGKVADQKIIIKTKSKFSVDSEDVFNYVFDKNKILFFDESNNARIYLDKSLGYHIDTTEANEEKE